MSFKSFYSQFDKYRDVGANDEEKGQLKKIYNDPGKYTEQEITKAYKGAIKVDRDNEYFFDDIGSDDEDFVFRENRYDTAQNKYQSALNSLLVRAKRPSENTPAAKPKPKPKPKKKKEPEGPVEYSPEIQKAIDRVRNYESPFGDNNANTEDRGYNGFGNNYENPFGDNNANTEYGGYNGFGNANQGEQENKQKQEPQVDPQSFLDKYKINFKNKPTVDDVSVGA